MKVVLACHSEAAFDPDFEMFNVWQRKSTSTSTSGAFVNLNLMKSH
jgi:hypothetical protein